MNLKLVGSTILAAAIGATSAAWADEAPKPPVFMFALHGFVGATLFAQEGVSRPSEGGLAFWASPQGTGAGTIGGKQPNTDKMIFNGDVRQSRFNFSVVGPQVLGATPKGVLEIDLFGGFAAGNFGMTSLLPRLRLAYMELDWGRDRIVVGQIADLSYPFLSYSLSHLGQPLAFVSGVFGWRRPGIFGFHTVYGDRKDLFVEVAWEVGAPVWAANSAIGGQNAVTNGALAGADRFGFNSGETSGLPALEARLLVGQGSTFQAYAAGHWNRIDRSGADSSGPGELDVLGLQLGAKGIFGPLTIQGQGFAGKNLAAVAAAFTQFQPNAVGDIHEMGGYVQAGYNFTPEWSLWGMIGTDQIKHEDAAAANALLGTYGVVQNVVSQGFIQYRVNPVAFSLELTHFYTKTLGTTRALDATPSVNQVACNAIYFF